MNCAICSCPNTELFLTRRGVPVHQNLLYKTEQQAIEAERGDLEMFVCTNCGFVFNGSFEPARLSYGENYENNQTFSPSFIQHVARLVSRVVDVHGVRGKTVVEVGCGSGYFLRRIVEADDGNHGFGFDPAYAGALVDFGGRLRFERRFFGPEDRDIAPDVVICRHVIEHVQEPKSMLLAIHGTLKGLSARVFFETPCVEWILQNEVFWDFFYEHCSLFSSGSLQSLFRRCGYGMIDVLHVFGGQYLWLEAGVGAASPEPASSRTVADLAGAYSQAELRRITRWRERLQSLKGQGGVAVWGAGAKGVTFTNLVDPEGDLIDFVVDINPSKQGHYIPIAAHPIVSPDALRQEDIAFAILMNPNYEAENRKWISEQGLDVQLINERI